MICARSDGFLTIVVVFPFASVIAVSTDPNKKLAGTNVHMVPSFQRSELEELVVVTRNPEKGIVIVAHRPKTKPTLEHKQVLKMETVQVGHLVGGRVLRHFHSGTVLKFSGKITGTLHPTDASDDYETGVPFPVLDSIVKATVISFDKDKKQLVVSTRASRIQPQDHPPIVDREISTFEELKVGETVRGFIKSIPEHGLFVTLGRSIDARVQIKELFDEVGTSVIIPFVSRSISYHHPVREGLAISFSSQPAC